MGSSSHPCAGRWLARTSWPWWCRGRSSFSSRCCYSSGATSCHSQWGLGKGGGAGRGFGLTDLSVLRPQLRSLHPLGEEDEDVARERERVVQGATQGDVLVLRDLTKVGAECWVGGLPLAHPPFSGT